MTDTETRPWVRRERDRRMHGVYMMADEQMLARLERGEAWTPLMGEAALIAELTPCDGSGVVLPSCSLCPACSGLGCSA